ncbi:MAG: response regulator [Promethearchaeota archaeon]
MTHEKIEKFNILVFNNGVKENKDLILDNKGLLEKSPFDGEYVLDTLHLLTCNLDDDVARKILASKLKELCVAGNFKSILAYKTFGFFHELSVEDLIYLLFDSPSPLTKNFLQSIEKCSLSVESLRKFFNKLSKEDDKAVIRLLVFFLTMGSKIRSDYRFRDALSQWKIWELFNFYKARDLSYEQGLNKRKLKKVDKVNRLNEISKYDLLLIGEDSSTVQLLVSYFNSRGYVCKGVISGSKGLEELGRTSPKVILLDIILPDLSGLLDIILPDLSGYDICRTIKSNNKLKKIKVFFLIPDSGSEVRKHLNETKADGYVLKPFNFSDFEIIFDILNGI